MKYETAESVTVGHPDKLADYIADTILDECMRQDPESRVACEVMLSHEVLMVAGEITTKAKVDYQGVAEKAIRDAGYAPPDSYLEDIFTQSPDIKQAVDESEAHDQGAGDQGIVYGYATDETLSMLPLAADLAHRLTNRIMTLRDDRESGFELGPDAKAQVTVAYENNGRLSHVASILVSVQHPETMTEDAVREIVIKRVILPALPTVKLGKTELIINPSGRFVKGGFEADTGLTGRKLMVDSYGGLARHGGGAFSGKDPSKVDRSGAYMARYIAKNIVAAGLAQRCEVSIAYAIGRSKPTMVNVETFGTGEYATDAYLATMIKRAFNLTPKGIIKTLGLKTTRYAPTAKYGHFGYPCYPWERLIWNGRQMLFEKLQEVLTDEAAGD